MTWNRSKQETLSLPTYAVALLILDDPPQQEWNWRYGMRASEDYGTFGPGDQDRARRAEGGDDGWPATRDAAQNSPDAYRMTRLGVETLTSGCAVKGDTRQQRR